MTKIDLKLVDFVFLFFKNRSRIIATNSHFKRSLHKKLFGMIEMVELRGFEPLSKIGDHLIFYMFSQLFLFEI